MARRHGFMVKVMVRHGPCNNEVKYHQIRGKVKGSQGKKTADTTEESVDVSDESDLKTLIRRKTSRRKLSRSSCKEVQDTHALIATESGIRACIETISRGPEHCLREIRSSVYKRRDFWYIPKAQQAFKLYSKQNKKPLTKRNAHEGYQEKWTGETAWMLRKTIKILNLILKILIAIPANNITNPKQQSNTTPIRYTVIAPANHHSYPEITPGSSPFKLRVAKIENKICQKACFQVKQKAMNREKSPEEIIRIKREQEEKKQEPTVLNAAMDKEVADTVKDHKRKHDGDDDDDDDDEGPPAGSNQESSRVRSKGGSKTGKTTPQRIQLKSLHDKIPDTTTWFRPIPEEERPASPEPEWVIPPIDLPEADNNWANAFAKAHQDPDENKLHNKIDDIGSFIRWYCRRIGKEELSKADLEGPAFMMVKGFHENNISLQFQMEECHKLLTNQIDLVNPEGHRIVPDISNPLPLGGPPGQVTIQPQFFFNKDLEYLLTGDKERNRALSISKLKAALYQDFGLEELVPSLWIESEREYDISAAYGITHWWFSRKQFYINKHSEPSDRDAVRSHMRILSVISIKTYERYGYNYLREIVLRRADYNEYKISEKDFKSLHPNDFEDLNILHIQGKLDHLPKQDKVNLHNADASDFPFKEDYTIVFKQRAVIYRDKDDNRKMMRIDEVHKFSDGTLTRIKEKLDFMVKDFKLFKFNKGMENRK
ncbi:hypothetical protein Tco_1575311 [Tanacetum coccineum]